LFVEMAALASNGTLRELSINDGTVNNKVSIAYTAVSNQIKAEYIVGGVSQASLTYTVTDVTAYHKIAFKYKVNDFALYVDGVERSTDVSGSVMTTGTLNSLDYHNGAGSSNMYNKTVKEKVYKLIAEAQKDLTYIPN